jgi:hypothetical protein
MSAQYTRRFAFVAFASVVCIGLLVQSAAACDQGTLSRLANGVSIAGLPQSNARPAILAAMGSSSPAPVPSAAPGMVGLWLVQLYYQGNLYDEYFDTWHSDGNELFIDATNPALDNVCQGLWKQMSPLTYKLKHVSWNFDPSGNPVGWADFHAVVQMSKDGNSFTGTEDVYIYDLNGNQVDKFEGGVLQATRIKIDF